MKNPFKVLNIQVLSPSVDQSSAEEGWVVCRVFRKKNFQKTLDHSPKSSSSTSMDSKLIHTLNPANKLSDSNILRDNPSSVLDQILLYMGRSNTCKIETTQPRLPVGINQSDFCDTASDIKLIQPQLPDLHERFMHLPRLECPTILPSIFPTPSLSHQQQPFRELIAEHDQDQSMQPPTVGDWAAFDRLVASQLNGQAETPPSSSAFGLQPADGDQEEEEEEDESEELATLMPGARISRPHHHTPQVFDEDENTDFWSFTRFSSLPESDPLRHLSV